MAKVNVQVAAKDYPAEGIKKGQTYYSWTPGFRGRLQRSATRPRPSQVATGKLSQCYVINETLQDDIDAAKTPGDIVDAMETAMNDIDELESEYRDTLENMPEGLQQGPTGQQLEENADALDGWRSELDDLKGEIESADCAEVLDIEVTGPLEFDDLTMDQQEVVMNSLRAMAQEGNNCPL